MLDQDAVLEQRDLGEVAALPDRHHPLDGLPAGQELGLGEDLRPAARARASPAGAAAWPPAGSTRGRPAPRRRTREPAAPRLPDVHDGVVRVVLAGRVVPGGAPPPTPAPAGGGRRLAGFVVAVRVLVGLGRFVGCGRFGLRSTRGAVDPGPSAGLGGRLRTHPRRSMAPRRPHRRKAHPALPRPPAPAAAATSPTAHHPRPRRRPRLRSQRRPRRPCGSSTVGWTSVGCLAAWLPPLTRPPRCRVAPFRAGGGDVGCGGKNSTPPAASSAGSAGDSMASLGGSAEAGGHRVLRARRVASGFDGRQQGLQAAPEARPRATDADELLTVTPRSASRAISALLLTPSRLASSWTRGLAGRSSSTDSTVGAPADGSDMQSPLHHPRARTRRVRAGAVNIPGRRRRCRGGAKSAGPGRSSQVDDVQDRDSRPRHVRRHTRRVADRSRFDHALGSPVPSATVTAGPVHYRTP